MFVFIHRAGKARVVAELPTGGTSELKFAGSSGDLFVTVASNIFDVRNRHLIANQNPGTAMYQIRGVGSGVEFQRLRI